MKMNLKMPLPFAVLAVAMGFLAAPVQAQWTVFNPVEQLQLAVTNSNVIQQVVQGAQMIQQGLNVYNLAMRETTILRNKQYMQAAGALSILQPIPGHSDWNMALTAAGGIASAAGVWQRMTMPGTTLSSRIQIADSFGTSMLNSLGNCNAAAAQTHGAIGELENLAMSIAALDNTHAALGGAANMGITQQLRIQECQHNLQQQQAQAQMISLMRQRDYENAQQTTYQNIGTISLQNPRGIVHLSGLMTANFN
jgi:hypothetical protein